MNGHLVVRRAGLGIASGFAGLAVFQFALAAGAPLGRAAWGGVQEYLPASLRVASAMTVLFYGVAIATVLRRAGFRVRGISRAVARSGTWVLAVVLTGSALMNGLSHSPWERFVMAPAGLVLAGSCLFLAAKARNPAGIEPGRRILVDK